MDDLKIHINQYHQHKDIISLVEQAFQYPSQYHFNIDFLPLFDDRFQPGHITAHIEEKLVGHIGYCQRHICIDAEKIPVIFLGGIAVAADYQGRGIFTRMMQTALESLQSQCAAFFLWSGDNKLYENFSFAEMGSVYQWGEGAFNFKEGLIKSTAQLSGHDITAMKSLYESTWSVRLERTQAQWHALKDMTSVKVHLQYLKGKLTAYALEGKGHDLGGIVHEFACLDMPLFMQEHQSQRIWSPLENQNNYSKMWLAMARKGGLWPWHDLTLNDFLKQTRLLIGGVDSI